MAQRGEWTDKRMDKQTLSPNGAAALPPPMKTKEKVGQGKGIADHLMPLGNLLFSRVYTLLCRSVC